MPRQCGAAEETGRAAPVVLQLSLDAQVVEVVLDLVLVLQQPVDRRLVAHGLADHLGGRLAVDVEEGLVVEVVRP